MNDEEELSTLKGALEAALMQMTTVQFCVYIGLKVTPAQMELLDGFEKRLILMAHESGHQCEEKHRPNNSERLSSLN